MYSRETKETPPSCSASVSNIEDSGYRTFTPSYAETSSCAVDSFDLRTANICLREKSILSTPRVAASTPRKCRSGVKNVSFNLQSPSKTLQTSTSKKENTPQKERKARKRDWRESEAVYNPFTPTNAIAVGLQNLRVRDDEVTTNNIPVCDNFSFSIGDVSKTYPTTPTKAHRNRIKKFKLRSQSLAIPRLVLSPIKQYINIQTRCRTAKKIDFSTEKSRRVILLETKVDLITRLSSKNIVNLVLDRLSGDDLFNFRLVCKSWNKILWDSNKRTKDKLKQYLTQVYRTKENLNNIERPNICSADGDKLKDIQNLVNNHSKIQPRLLTCEKTPPSTPKTRKYLRFIKHASVDSAVKLMRCVRCDQPAEIKKEPCGEEWAQCKNRICGYTYCNYCHCERHPNQSCTGYDHEAASPSKRQRRAKTNVQFKSKKNLRRLLS